jgi:lipopolysaccharide export system permease protein
MTFTLYLSRVYLFSVAAAALALGALAELLELLENGNAVIARYGNASDLVRYALLLAPAIGASVIPIACLTGAMITFAGLARHNETTVIRSSGVTLYWIVSRLAPAALLIGLLYFTLRFVIAPHSEIRAYEWVNPPGTASGADAEPRQDYWIGSTKVIISFASADEEGRLLQDATIFERDAMGHLLRHTTAEHGRYQEGVWVFDGARSLALLAPGTHPAHADSFALTDGPSPTDIRAAMIPGARARLSPPGLAGAMVWAGRNSPAFLMTNLFDAMAAPFAPLVMLLAAAPLALGTSRYPSQGRYVGMALGTGFGYLLIGGICRAFGEAGILPAALAIFGPLAIFLIAGVSIIAYLEG